MKIGWNSLGHLCATWFERVMGNAPKIEAAVEAGIAKVEGTEATVETVTAAASAVAPVFGPLALTVEKAGYAVLGELAAVLHAGDAAAEAKLANAGLDINVINTVKSLLASSPQLVALVKTL